jgi:SAM-dependent methyltransferase
MKYAAMAGEAEIVGRLLPPEAWRMILKRYEVIATYAAGRRLLDVCCGAGLGLGYLARAGVREVWGVDLSPENVAQATALNGEAARCSVMDAHRLEFDDGRFDAVSCMEAIQYLDADRFLEEVRRVLTPGGALILCQPNPLRRDGFHPSRLSRRYYASDGLADLLHVHGFDPAISGAFPLPPNATCPSALLAAKLRRAAIRLCLAIPGGERLKNALIGHVATRVPVRAITEADVAEVKGVSLTPLKDGAANDDSQILYAVGTKRLAPLRP